MKKKPNPRRPERGTKGPMNQLLSQADQGKRYRVKAFTIQPEVTLIDADGKEERRYLGPTLALYEAQFGKTVVEFMASLGLKLEGGEGGT